MRPSVKQALFGTLALGGLLALSAQGLAQRALDLEPIVQGVTDRQAERLQNQAIERVQQQAEAAQARVAEQVQVQQVETVQGQIVDRVENQVERAQAQTAERAQNQVERVQNQVERVQGRIERAPEQALDRTAERLDAVAEGRPGAVVEAGPGVERAAAQAGQGPAVPVAAAVEDTPAPLPEVPVRRAVPDAEGIPVFVELTLTAEIRAIEFEWVMLVNAAQRQQLEAEAPQLLGFLAGAQPFTLTDGELLTFRVPPDLDANDAILQLVPANLRGQIDRNHLYATQDAKHPATGSLPLAMPMAAVCEAPLAIGIIDSAIDTRHAAFGPRVTIHGKSFVEAQLEPALAHGTAVASVLVGSAEGLQPLLPHAELYSAAVFHANEDAVQGATVMRVLAALDWLASVDEVRVINMSLAGPANRLLEQAVAAMAKEGKVVVAAVGNEGAHGPLRYPAAYTGVVGVTAVDRSGEIYRWANQGPQIDYAALGVAVPVAQAGGGITQESGTSLAAPVVSAFHACALAGGKELAAAALALQDLLVDLGEPGLDPVFGKGLLHP